MEEIFTRRRVIFDSKGVKIGFYKIVMECNIYYYFVETIFIFIFINYKININIDWDLFINLRDKASNLMQT